MTPAFAYLQARLQAHHGQRLNEQEWHRLETVIPYRLFLKNGRETSLAPWLQAIGDTDEPPVLEHRLREALGHTVAQVTGWAPPEWRPAITWTTHLWQLTAWRHLWEGNPLPPGLLLTETAGIALLKESWRAGTPLLEGWIQHWQRVWPTQQGKRQAALEALIPLLHNHANGFATLPEAAAARTARQQLQERLRGLFRRHAGQPAALFVHLALMALDFERLRGGLVWRALYHTPEEGSV